MNPLKIVLTFTFAVFLTIGLLANQNIENNFETNQQVDQEKPLKVSAVQAISLFNFFKIETTNTDSIKSTSAISEIKLKAFFDYFIYYSKP
jgi:exosortase/archaeosortase